MQSVRARVLFLVAAFLVAASAQEIRIISGPVDNQVFQRTADQTADIGLSGTATLANAMMAGERPCTTAFTSGRMRYISA